MTYAFVDKMKKAEQEFNEKIDAAQNNPSFQNIRDSIEPLLEPAYLIAMLHSGCSTGYQKQGDVRFSVGQIQATQPLWDNLFGPIRTVYLTQDKNVYSEEELIDILSDKAEGLSENAEEAFDTYDDLAERERTAAGQELVDCGHELVLMSYELFANGEAMKRVPLEMAKNKAQREGKIFIRAQDPDGLFELVGNNSTGAASEMIDVYPPEVETPKKKKRFGLF